MENHRSKLLYLLIIVVFLGVFWAWYIFSGTDNHSIVVSEEKSAETDESIIMVYITGAVVNPGVVSLSSQARLVEAISQVGGFSENADQDSINLARRVKDEEKIHIPFIGETKETGQSSEGLVNINTAGLEELKKLPGVGDVIGQGIIDYREKNGPFTSLEELKNVNRIGEKIYEGLSELIIL